MWSSNTALETGGIVPAMWIELPADEPVACSHTGGTATCKAKAICELCGEEYGDINADNHVDSAEWITDADSHKQIYNCCNAVKVAEADHNWDNGVCTVCRYGCDHVGGTATCKSKAICELCGVAYGKVNASNHAGVLEWITDADSHKQIYNCCNAVKVAEADHNWKNGVCTVCSYGCDHVGGSATCTHGAVCDSCGNTYSEPNKANHTGVLEWITDADSHKQIYSCCDAVKVAEADHNWDNGVCSDCEYACAHKNENHVCAICAIALGHNYVNGACTECELSVNGNKVTFGSYPQSKVTDGALISALNANASAWTSSNDKLYADVENNGELYRGVKAKASDSASWFKYEPISWTILEEKDGKAFLLCDMIIDAKAYDNDSNNYEKSDIRAWLNAEFINTAFNELQREVIATTLVDNNDNVINDYSNGNKFFCEDTEDKIFLIAKGEVKNSAYGFSSNTDRKMTVTEYAKANGVYADASNGGWWWMRTPCYDSTKSDRSDLAHNLKVDGSIWNTKVSTATGGVVPAMWINI